MSRSAARWERRSGVPHQIDVVDVGRGAQRWSSCYLRLEIGQGGEVLINVAGSAAGWSYFVRPTNSIVILAITIYMLPPAPVVSAVCAYRRLVEAGFRDLFVA